MKLNRLRNLRYLKKEIVFFFDLGLSILATIGAVLLSYTDAEVNNNVVLIYSTLSLLVSILLILAFGLQRNIVRYFGVTDMMQILLYSMSKSSVILMAALVIKYQDFALNAAFMDFMLTAISMITVRGCLVMGYAFIMRRTAQRKIDVFVYSTLGSNPLLVKQINDDITSRYRVRGIITTNSHKAGMQISGQRVYFLDESDRKLHNLLRRNNVEAILFTSSDTFKRAQGRLIDFCIQEHIAMYMMGEISEIDQQTGIPQRQIKPVQIEDLLNREEIQVDLNSIENEIQGKVVMVTGGAGSIGSEIVRQVAGFNAKTLVLFKLSETPLHEIQLELNRKFPQMNIKYILGDVRSKQRVKAIIQKYRPSIIFHAAAYKHVPMIERNPCEGVMTNVWGTVNVAQRAIENGVEKFVMISTDKAVNPTNVMGATKRIAEMCVQSMNRKHKTAFITTRFGNVLGSNGSVIPLFRQQIAAGGPLTITHPEITRYFMSIPEACRLVLQAATMGHTGEILVFDMGEQVKIIDLARKMISLSGLVPEVDIKIECTGLRPGEKLYEELFQCDEDMATSHKKINIAKCRGIDPELIERTIKRLALHARQTDVEDTVRLMKVLVPEFISQNSEFEKLDK